MISRRQLSYVVAGGALLSAMTLLFLFDPAGTKWFPACPVHSATGCYCPGCGSLRALHRLFHGDLSGAFSMNPLMILALPFLGLLLLRPSMGYKTWLPWGCFAALLLYGILRNIPLSPFNWLMPH